MPRPARHPKRKPRPEAPPRPVVRASTPAEAPAAADLFELPRLAAGVRVIFEDEDVVVIDKPPGLLSASPPGRETTDGTIRQPSAFTTLKEHVRKGVRPNPQRRDRSGEPVRRDRVSIGAQQGLWIVHRLDREVSGLMVFAKSERAFAWLKEDFRTRRVQRTYIAALDGEIGQENPSGKLAQDAGSIQTFLREVRPGLVVSIAPEKYQGDVVGVGRRRAERDAEGDEQDEETRLAVTHYRTLARGKGCSLVEIRLETGRKHQIRVHMRELGHPVVGDHRYGFPQEGARPRGKPRKNRAAKDRTRLARTTGIHDPIGRLALHAASLGFHHPATGQLVMFRSEPPRAFLSLLGVGPEALPTVERAPEAPSAPFASPPARAPEPPSSPAAPAQLQTSWDAVANWYDDLIDERKSDHYTDVILPGALRLLEARPGQRVLDVACGQGVLARELAALGVETVGVDASEKLVEMARRRAAQARGSELMSFHAGDARTLDAMDLGLFDAAACVMALMNIEPLDGVFRGVAKHLKPGGRFVAIILHPVFRAPRQTSWGWEETRDEDRRSRSRTRGPTKWTQYRRIDGYLSPAPVRIVGNPGEVAAGKEAVETWSFHRPLQTYVRACAGAGLLVDRLEEWPSLRASSSGPRAEEENRARREIPMFLGLRAVKPA